MGAKEAGVTLWSDITGVADRMIRFTKGVLKNFLLLVSRPQLGDSAPLELESHQLTGSPPDWGNLGLDVPETPKPESRQAQMRLGKTHLSASPCFHTVVSVFQPRSSAEEKRLDGCRSIFFFVFSSLHSTRQRVGSQF